MEAKVAEKETPITTTTQKKEQKRLKEHLKKVPFG